MTNKNTIQKLRQQTGAGIMDIKNALERADGDETRTLKILKKKNQEIAVKKQSERTTSEGIIESYVHANGKVASLIMLSCETDFVAKNKEFKNLAHEIAMQVAAMNPENIPSLLEQNFIKDENKTIREVINEATAKLGEKIEIKNITRFQI